MQNIGKVFQENLIGMRQKFEKFIESEGDPSVLRELNMQVDSLLKQSENIVEAIREIQILKGAISSIRKENAKLKKMEKSSPETEEIYQKYDFLQLENSTLCKKNEDLQKECDQLQTQILSIQDEKKFLQEQIERLQEEFQKSVPQEEPKTPEYDTMVLSLSQGPKSSYLNFSSSSEKPKPKKIQKTTQKGEEDKYLSEIKVLNLLQIEKAKLEELLAEGKFNYFLADDGQKIFLYEDIEKYRKKTMESDTKRENGQKNGMMNRLKKLYKDHVGEE